MPTRLPGRRERLEIHAAAGDPLAKAQLQDLTAAALARRARAEARRRAAGRWQRELGRVPIVPASSPADAVLLELPRLIDTRPRRSRRRARGAHG